MRSHYAAFVVVSLFGCMPSDVLRTPHVASAGRASFNAKASYSVAPATLTYSATSLDGTSSGTVSGNSADVAAAQDAAPVIFPQALIEAGAAIGLFRPCELGGRVGFVALGAEARCEPFDARHGAPLSLALSFGGGFEPWIFGYPYLRGGADLAVKFGDYELLLGAYARGSIRRYTIGSDALPEEPPEHCCPTGLEGLAKDRSLWIERNELRLSLPIGLAYTFRRHEATRREHRFLFGAVPSVELSGYDMGSDCSGCDPDVEVQVTSFENPIVVTLVMGFEWGTD